MPEWLREWIDRTDDCNDNRLGLMPIQVDTERKKDRWGILGRRNSGHCCQSPQRNDEEQNKIEWRCEFCGRRYPFSREQQARLMENIGGSGIPR